MAILLQTTDPLLTYLGTSTYYDNALIIIDETGTLISGNTISFNGYSITNA